MTDAQLQCWQRTLVDLRAEAELEIARTPTSELRNALTEINIHLICVEEAVKKTASLLAQSTPP